MRMRRLAPLCLLATLAAACSGAPRALDTVPAQCAAPHAAHIRHELYIGMGIPGDSAAVVTDEAWAAFSEEVLSHRFAAGMTVLDAYGEWRDRDGMRVREPTRVVIHLAPIEDGGSAIDAVEAVIAEAKARFAQHSVMWQRSLVCVAF